MKELHAMPHVPDRYHLCVLCGYSRAMSDEHTTGQSGNISQSNRLLSIRQITFSSGDTVHTDDARVTVFVGPNNAGKSACLAELYSMFELGTKNSGLVVDNIELDKGVPEALISWMNARHEPIPGIPGEPTYNTPRGSQIAESYLLKSWQGVTPMNHERYGDAIGEASHFVTRNIGIDNRANLASGADRTDLLTPTSRTIFDTLYLNYPLEKEISELSKKAFGSGLTLERLGGTRVCLRVGEIDLEPPTIRDYSIDYARAERALPELDRQGHGFRSFFGVYLPIKLQPVPVTFIDEPEMFLHPPQARLLGRVLGDLRNESTQIFIATHSTDIINGLIESDASIQIVRITREGNKNHVKELSTRQLRDIWSDYILRYSRVLDGIFYEHVVVCEGDADCRFYGAVLQEMSETKQIDLDPSNVLFLSGGGKAKIPTILDSLHALGVKASAIVDIDLVRDVDLLKKRYLHGHREHWDEIKQDWITLNATIVNTTPPESKDVVLARIKDLIDKESADRIGSKTATEIRSVLKNSEAWSRIKLMGVGGLPTRQAGDAMRAIIQKLKRHNIVVLDVGELESFDKEIKLKGGDFVAAALEQGLHKSSEPARKHVRLALNTRVDSESAPQITRE